MEDATKAASSHNGQLGSLPRDDRRRWSTTFHSALKLQPNADTAARDQDAVLTSSEARCRACSVKSRRNKAASAVDNTDCDVSAHLLDTVTQTEAGAGRSSGSSKAFTEFARLLTEITRLLRRIEQHSSKHDATLFGCQGNRIAAEWRQISVVLDRIFFTIFLVIIVASLVLLFPRPAEF